MIGWDFGTKIAATAIFLMTDVAIAIGRMPGLHVDRASSNQRDAMASKGLAQSARGG